jgi:glycosyltransferase involved in cell wall biosynthesis
MKIGIDLTSFQKNHNGGKEQVLFNLLKGFNELGASKEITIFCYPYLIEVIRKIISEAEIITVQPMSFPKKFLADYWFKTFRLPKLIKKHGITVLFFPVSHTGLRRMSIPTAVLPHDIQPISRRKSFHPINYLKYRCIYHFDFLLRDHIFSISDFDHSQLETHYPQHAHKFKRIYNPIAMKPNPNPPTRVQEIMAINIQFPHKNIETLIKAFSLIQDQIPHKLVLVGSAGKKTACLSDCIVENNLEDRVRFTGFLSEEALYHRLEKCALYVNPSIFEGFGMTAIEAMILKVPVIVADATASPEVTKGLCAYYAPATDETKLADSMLALLQNPPDDTALQAISKTIFEAYTYTKIAREYLQFFQSIRKSKPSEVTT